MARRSILSQLFRQSAGYVLTLTPPISKSLSVANFLFLHCLLVNCKRLLYSVLILISVVRIFFFLNSFFLRNKISFKFCSLFCAFNIVLF